ncbi:hypothetical protein M409DRAFT_16938 [Zasmidium cellare ATCC 36951]|uniref:Uncharacterized protein n=1 Tax=Zasmidium cellare ATCC 36951 TaxID=1080233 RepID=A0A6A6D3G0_ZASCE|nr:uncharacterized protein M409DRAFT_16938 [Zasmidium cellare ATCC 36951]KAF2172988.1 hypothetical protein M409DRAFT_16938 [Zasmidium cellare ATCC 36951]
MGNCFGKSSSTFQGEGRTLGAQPSNAPAQSNNASAAAPAKISAPAGGRTLGRNPQAPGESHTPGEAAAKAAELGWTNPMKVADCGHGRDELGAILFALKERLKASQGKGKLGKQLDAQKGQTQAGTLAQNARDNVAARDADAAAEARNWN